MLTNDRLRELRETIGARPDEMAVMLSVGVASIYRWEREGSSLPSGLVLELYRALDELARQDADLGVVHEEFRSRGPMAAVRWILNHQARLQEA